MWHRCLKFLLVDWEDDSLELLGMGVLNTGFDDENELGDDDNGDDGLFAEHDAWIDFRLVLFCCDIARILAATATAFDSCIRRNRSLALVALLEILLLLDGFDVVAVETGDDGDIEEIIVDFTGSHLVSIVLSFGGTHLTFATFLTGSLLLRFDVLFSGFLDTTVPLLDNDNDEDDDDDDDTDGRLIDDVPAFVADVLL